MTCPQCGTEIAVGRAACPGCGTQVTAAGPTVTGPSLGSYSFDASRWSRTDRITGIATAVLLISLFLPWFGVNYGFVSATVNGLWHGWMYLVLLVSLAVLVYLAARAGIAELPVPHDLTLLVAAGVNVVLTVLAFLLKPGGGVVGWEFGAFVGLAAAIVAVAPLVPGIGGLVTRGNRAGHP